MLDGCIELLYAWSLHALSYPVAFCLLRCVTWVEQSGSLFSRLDDGQVTVEPTNPLYRFSRPQGIHCAVEPIVSLLLGRCSKAKKHSDLVSSDGALHTCAP